MEKTPDHNYWPTKTTFCPFFKVDGLSKGLLLFVARMVPGDVVEDQDLRARRKGPLQHVLGQGVQHFAWVEAVPTKPFVLVKNGTAIFVVKKFDQRKTYRSPSIQKNQENDEHVCRWKANLMTYCKRYAQLDVQSLALK